MTKILVLIVWFGDTVAFGQSQKKWEKAKGKYAQEAAKYDSTETVFREKLIVLANRRNELVLYCNKQTSFQFGRLTGDLIAIITKLEKLNHADGFFYSRENMAGELLEVENLEESLLPKLCLSFDFSNLLWNADYDTLPSVGDKNKQVYKY